MKALRGDLLLVLEERGVEAVLTVETLAVGRWRWRAQREHGAPMAGVEEHIGWAGTWAEAYRCGMRAAERLLSRREEDT